MKRFDSFGLCHFEEIMKTDRRTFIKAATATGVGATVLTPLWWGRMTMEFKDGAFDGVSEEGEGIIYIYGRVNKRGEAAAPASKQDFMAKVDESMRTLRKDFEDFYDRHQENGWEKAPGFKPTADLRPHERAMFA